MMQEMCHRVSVLAAKKTDDMTSIARIWCANKRPLTHNAVRLSQPLSNGRQLLAEHNDTHTPIHTTFHPRTSHLLLFSTLIY